MPTSFDPEMILVATLQGGNNSFSKIQLEAAAEDWPAKDSHRQSRIETSEGPPLAGDHLYKT
jgi:hypothetical protein